MLSSVWRTGLTVHDNQMEPRDATSGSAFGASTDATRQSLEEAFSPQSGANPLITSSVASTFRSIE